MIDGQKKLLRIRLTQHFDAKYFQQNVYNHEIDPNNWLRIETRIHAVKITKTAGFLRFCFCVSGPTWA